jgi:hypothetical protein
MVTTHSKGNGQRKFGTRIPEKNLNNLAHFEVRQITLVTIVA